MAATLDPPPCEALIFDCDGTLADTFDVHYAVLRELLAKAGIDFDRAWYRERTGMSSRDLVAAINARWKAALDIVAFDRNRLPLYDDAFGEVREMAAVTTIARRYFGRMPLAVASGGTRSIVEKTLATLGISGLFSLVVTIEDVSRGKPAPDLYTLAAARLRVAAEDCVVYEDTDEGLAAAKSAGMRAIDVRPFIAK